jgi:uncharacterized membrane protein
VTIQINKNLGRWGALLTLLGIISTLTSVIEFFLPKPNVGATLGLSLVSLVVGLAAFVGFVLFLVAMYGFSKDYGERKIFDYLLYGLIGSIAGVIVLAILGFAFVLGSLFSAFPNLNGSTNASAIQSTLMPSLLVFTGLGLVIGLIWIFLNYKAINLLAKKSEVPTFKTAAKLLLAGPLINIVVVILIAALVSTSSIENAVNVLTLVSVPGSVVQYIAWWLMAKGFSEIKVPPIQNVPSTYAPLASVQAKYCSHCGTPTQFDSEYCTKCGQKL